MLIKCYEFIALVNAMLGFIDFFLVFTGCLRSYLRSF